MRKANNPKVTIQFELEDCAKCPKVDTKHMVGHSAMDYFCKAMGGKKICGYIEWPSEMRGVPDWCPHRVDELNRPKEPEEGSCL